MACPTEVKKRRAHSKELLHTAVVPTGVALQEHIHIGSARHTITTNTADIRYFMFGNRLARGSSTTSGDCGAAGLPVAVKASARFW